MKRYRCESFDFEHFKEFVNTYDPKKHGCDSPETIFKDMLYGLGIAIDKKRFGYADGFKKFKKRMFKRIESQINEYERINDKMNKK